MTEQPETMLEYHFRKLQRVVVTAVLMLCTVLFTVGGVLATDTYPSASLLLLFGAVSMLFLSSASTSDGVARKIINAFGEDSFTDLERPDETPQEVPADD